MSRLSSVPKSPSPLVSTVFSADEEADLQYAIALSLKESQTCKTREEKTNLESSASRGDGEGNCVKPVAEINVDHYAARYRADRERQNARDAADYSVCDILPANLGVPQVKCEYIIDDNVDGGGDDGDENVDKEKEEEDDDEGEYDDDQFKICEFGSTDCVADPDDDVFDRYFDDEFDYAAFADSSIVLANPKEKQKRKENDDDDDND